jgi:GDPmannose 4,6-dehydratase
MPKRALITGITGQDGSYLAEYLLELGYEVHGLVRRVAQAEPEARLSRLAGILPRLQLHPASLESYASIYQLLAREAYDEIYHLAAQSFVAESFADSFTTMNVNSQGTHHLLEGVRLLQPRARFYFAATSEMFGKVEETPQRETTKFHPRSPYGVSKVAGYYLTLNYREAYSLYACSGILFNHESPRRGHEFVTRKITRAVARIALGLESELRLGNLEARRDWGHAADYVRAMHLMLQTAAPRDYVVASGETHTVREFCELAFGEVGLDYRDHVRLDARFERPAEVDLLLGDASAAQRDLGWAPRHSFRQLVAGMVAADLELLGGRATGSLEALREGVVPVRVLTAV